MKTTFDKSWVDWINTNVAAGCDKDGIFKILLDEGYAYDAIKRQMNYEPSMPVVFIANPLKQAAKAAEKNAQQNANAPKARGMYIPNSMKFASDKLELYTLDSFLNAQECNELIELIQAQQKKSKSKSKAAKASIFECNLDAKRDTFIAEIDQRICKLLGINPAYSEMMQGQYIQAGGESVEYKSYFEVDELPEQAMGQRSYTLMVYLNNVDEGGETEFKKIGHSVTPQLGKAVIWNNATSDGLGNKLSIYQDLPVLQGYKAVIKKSFRLNAVRANAGEMYTKEINEYVPNYTRKGFHKTKLPAPLFNKIKQFYAAGIKNIRDEHVEGGFVYNEESTKQSSVLVELSDELRKEIHDSLKPDLEEWCQAELKPAFVYGIRIYLDGAVLKPHRDRIETHIIGVIINVAQEVDEPWPLMIDDNTYRQHKILLEPGDIVFYESARLTHGRPLPFKGKGFANVFCHFTPVDYQHPV